VIIELGL